MTVYDMLGFAIDGFLFVGVCIGIYRPKITVGKIVKELNALQLKR
tara:strand:- start:4001 stop:4135 length:135 start_codon:yes stop_codon:yes gene_type:complete